MPFKWREIFTRENDLVKASTAAAVESHADPHAVLEVTIRKLQDDHDALEKTCAVVLGHYKTTQQALEADLRLKDQLDLRGHASMQAGHGDAAQAIARQLAAVNARLESEQRAFDHAREAAEKAKAAFAENGRMLAAKMAEAKQLHAEIDEAAMDHNINEAMRSVNSMTSRETPSFDAVRERVNASIAKEEGDSELQQLDAVNTGVGDEVLAGSGEADLLMAGWGEPKQVVATREPTHGPAHELPEGRKKETKGTDALFS